ncbi:hypothetical protein FKM82_010543 [Ascaphus truei]
MAAPTLLGVPLLSFLVVLVAYWYREVDEQSLQSRLNTVLSSLLRAEQKVGLDVERPPRVAIGQREARLQALQELLLSMDQRTGSHFEMASFVEHSLMKDLLEYVIPYSDSLGMNEQELPNLLSLIKGGNITVLSDPYPRVASILDQMRELYQLLQSQELKEGQRRLTRLHVHTLAFQAIIVTKGSMWKNTMSATAKASLTANRHVCGSSQIDTHKAKLIMDDSFSVSREVGSPRIPLSESRPVSCWEEDNYEICLAPVLVCTDVFQTAGGGDNISAAGLVLQI